MKSTIAKKTEGYGYKYTELADINKYCEDNGITYYQEVETNEINQKDYIITTLQYGDKEIKRRGCQIVEAVLSGIKNPVQEYGSSLTYCRRYSLLMALGLATEDDDAASLTIKKEATLKDAEEWTFKFGKYKGETMKYVLEADEQYVEWYINNKANDFDIKCYELLSGKKIPSEEEQEQILKRLAELENLLSESDIDREKLYSHYQVKSNQEMTLEQLEDAIKKIKK